MTFSDFRKEFPEYDDISDEELSDMFEIEKEYEPEEDLVVPALADLKTVLERLCQITEQKKFPDQNADVIALLKQIKNGLGSLEVAINKIDVNVTTAAPVVKVPPQIVQELILPEPIKEWTFDIIRDRNGFAKSVIARA